MRNKCMTRILATKEGPIILGTNLFVDLPNTLPGTCFHLYILSNDKIKDGDWVFVDLSKNKTGYKGKGVWQYKTPPCPLPYWGNPDCAKKIIASTDPKLGLASPSITFIEKFLSEYNKGHLIRFVMVEYEQENTPKVLAETNTIITKPVKTSWTRPDIITLLKLYNTALANEPDLIRGWSSFNNWTDENI